MINSNPRNTNYISTTAQENNAIKIISEIRQMKNLTVHFVLCKYIQCHIIKDEPQFIEILFQDHLPIVTEMIEWLLTPNQIAQRKKIKSNIDFFPFRCKQFMKDNIPFYEQLYLYAHNNKLPITIWFNFLRKQFYDKQTILTALGFFAEVMIPFAKYQFSSSANLTQSVQLARMSQKIETLSIMKILPKSLIEQLIKYSHYEPIFQFIKTAILVSIEDIPDYQISKITMLKMLENAQTPQIFQKLNMVVIQNQQEIDNKVNSLQNVSLCLKQLVANIDPTNDMQFRIQSLIYIFLESKTIPYAINEILSSKFCQNFVSRQQTQSAVFGYGSSQNIGQSSLNMSTVSLSSVKGSPNSPKNTMNLLSSCQQEDLMEILLSILTYSVQIFIKIPKTVPIIKKNTINMNMQQVDAKQLREVNYRTLIKIFRQQLQNLLISLQTMIKVVYTEGQSITTSITKPIPFSSGQKIKPISLMKFQFLKLLHKSLLLIPTKDATQGTQKQSSQLKSPVVKKFNSINFAPFEINFQKVHFIQIIQKYLNQNRWNNLAHHVLQQICHSLILCGYDYLRKNIEKDRNKKLTQSFLAFLIQNFTQRDYIFLNTLKFTTQGNLHSLYKISRDLAYTLKSTNQLSILLSQFEPWKKFLMNDLKIYEEKAYPDFPKPEGIDKQEQTATKIQVDQVDTIKKLIQNISETPKWPNKITKPKGNSKSGIYLTEIRNSDQKKQGNLTSMAKSHDFDMKNKKQSPKLNKFPNLNILYKRSGRQQQQSIQLSAQQLNQLNISQINSDKLNLHTKSEIKQKKEQQMYKFFKNYSKYDKKPSQRSI